MFRNALSSILYVVMLSHCFVLWANPQPKKKKPTDKKEGLENFMETGNEDSNNN